MRFVLLVGAIGVALTGSLADAGNHKSKAAHCPPGLAKKNPPCVPPGQARTYGIGDRITGDFRIVQDPGRYGLKRDKTYYRVGDYVYEVDQNTREVLDLIGAVAAILN